LYVAWKFDSNHAELASQRLTIRMSLPECRQMKIRKGDTVQVIAGADIGKRGEVLNIDRKKGKVTIQGVHRVLKHVKRGHPKSPQGGRLNLELPIDVSNIAVICPKTDKPSRIGIRINDDGSKERFAKVSGASLGQISPARASRARK
jgi:large subunit ribosomal protein L24